MSYLKTLGLAILTAGAVLAVSGAGSASATELTCTQPEKVIVMCPEKTHIHMENHITVVWHPPIGNIECTSMTITGDTTNTGSSTTTVDGTISSVSISGCNAEVVVLKPGEFIIHTTETNANHNGTITWTGLEMTMTFAGFHCIFSTSATDIGDLTGSTTTGGTPTLDLKGVVPRTGGRSGAFCGSSAEWTGAFKITTPDWMDVD